MNMIGFNMPRKRKKIYIDVPYSLKNTAKTMGAMWDSDEKRWFIYDTFDFEALVKLLEENKKEGVLNSFLFITLFLYFCYFQ